MDDSVEYEWILLLHHLPPKPDYFRVRIRRNLQQLGAVGLKNSAYVLPASERSRREFEQLAAAIRRDGGEAVVAETRILSGISSAELAARFRGESDAAYAEVTSAARQIAESAALERSGAIERLEQRLAGVHARDHFGSGGQALARAALQELRNQAAAESAVAGVTDRPAGAVWLTRQNVSVDRIASAWLVSRFIDRKARFKFAPAGGVVAGDEVEFGTDRGGYGRDADHSAFANLLIAFSLESDSGLQALAELVHDLEFETQRYGRPEAAGLNALIQGVVTKYASDAERVEQGRRVFDQLYAHYTRLAL